jgi:DNA-binding response OmpR family regulator
MARVALVEGDPDLVSLVTEVLREGGHEVVADTPPENVVTELIARPPDLVILDPWLDTPRQGWEILTLLLEDERTRDVPVIVYSGAVDHLREKDEWLRHHCITPLRKPFELRTLERLIEDAVAG